MKYRLFLILFLSVIYSCGYSPKTIEVNYFQGTKDTMTYNCYDFEIDKGNLYIIRATIYGGNEKIAENVKFIARIN
jgi:hypothetical protein